MPSRPSRLVDLGTAVGLVPSGAHVAFGGRPLHGKPMGFVRALAEGGARDLEVTALFGSLDFELLARGGALAATTSSYVGLEHLGGCAAHRAQVANGAIKHLELSEYMLMLGLDAAGHGLPFLPTRAALGSQLVEDRGLAVITCPYTGDPLLAVPAIAPDVAVIHAEAADERGNVLGPPLPSFLWDHDRAVARAARRTIVTVERIVDTAVIRANAERTYLCAFEVDAVVELPGGAAPTGGHGYSPDWRALAELARSSSSGPHSPAR
jgi:glutaconate CoA-transferase subunit A